MSTYLLKLDMKRGIKNSHFSNALPSKAKDEFEQNENIKYRVIEIKSDEQNLAFNFQYFSFELLWFTIIREVERMVG